MQEQQNINKTNKLLSDFKQQTIEFLPKFCYNEGTILNGGNSMMSNQIKYFRQQKGLTQKELANHLHVTAQAVSRWELGVVGYHKRNGKILRHFRGRIGERRTDEKRARSTQ